MTDDGRHEEPIAGQVVRVGERGPEEAITLGGRPGPGRHVEQAIACVRTVRHLAGHTNQPTTDAARLALRACERARPWPRGQPQPVPRSHRRRSVDPL